MNECEDIKGGEHLGRYVNYLSRLIKNAFNGELSRCGADITGEQGRLIGYVFHRQLRGEEIFQRDIERDFSIRRSSAASILAHLERGGYIERTGDSSDGRVKKITATDKSRELDAIVSRHIESLEEHIARGMSENEKAEFLRLIKLAIQNLEDYK